jgi:vacuolar-type H+-ATPase subunit H
MKNGKLNASPQAEQAIQRVLQAERDAEHAIQDCENEARQIIHDAQNRAQLINTRIDQRITNMEMRHSHKLDKTIKAIEKKGADELRLDAGNHYDSDNLKTVIEQLAIELCQADAATED